jgi:isopropylmalate/homocitrate/citramalate synthase
MSRHRKNNPHRVAKRVAASVGAVATLASLTATASPANALLEPADKSVAFTNATWIGHCRFEVKSVDADNGTIYAKVIGYAQPRTLAGYGTAASTTVHCFVMPGGDTNPDDNLMRLDASRPGSTVPATDTFANIAYYGSYTLCGYAVVVLKNGDTQYTQYACA